MESGKTYTFTFDNSDQNRTVACTVSGEGSGTVTPTEKYCSFYLIGDLHGNSEWTDGTKANPFTTIDGKTYTYTFTGVGKTVYFRFKVMVLMEISLEMIWLQMLQKTNH